MTRESGRIVRSGSGLGSRVSRRDVLRTGALGGMALAAPWVLQACGSSPSSAAQGNAKTPKRGGSLIWAMDEDPVNLVPLGMTNTSNYWVTSLIYESLTMFDRTLAIKPGLAESWETPDDLTYIFKLRKNVRFHSGKAFGSDDVLYSLKQQKNPPPPGSVTAYYPKIASVEAMDQYTVKISLSQPDTTVLGYFAWNEYSHIIPNGLYERIDPRTQSDGTGPFKLVEYVPNDHVTLARNTGYWNSSLPYLDNLTMKVLPDEQTRLAALQSGAVDGSNDITADSARTVSGYNSLQVLKGLTAAFCEMELTIHGDGKPWDQLKVRQAINKAIDRQEIIDKVFGGDAVYTSKIPAGYGEWAISPTALKSSWQKYDLAGAKKLMAEAGMSSGFSVQLQSISQPASYTENAQVIKAQLQKININVNVQPLEIATFGINNANGSFQWQSTGRGMRGDPSEFFTDFDPAGSIYQAWFKGGYDSSAITASVKQAMTTVDAAKRKQVYDQMQQTVLTDLPTIPLVNPMQYHIVRSRVHGMYVDYGGLLRGLTVTWVD
ncbi:MAG: ABC transporter substrate-binding protein [Candidatus Dormiibacterota bacterium]